MMEFPEAASGDPITAAAWSAARRFVMAHRLKPGPGIRLRRTVDGTIVSLDAKSAKWLHPFRVTLSGNAAQVGVGFVDGAVLPEINGVPLGGNEDEPAPLLEFPEPQLDRNGRGYIALEAHWDEKWQLLKEHAVTVIQCARIDSLDAAPTDDSSRIVGGGGVPLLPGRRARWALAMIRRRESGRLDLYQVVRGDLQVQAQPDSPGAETGRVIWW